MDFALELFNWVRNGAEEDRRHVEAFYNKVFLNTALVATAGLALGLILLLTGHGTWNAYLWFLALLGIGWIAGRPTYQLVVVLTGVGWGVATKGTPIKANAIAGTESFYTKYFWGIGHVMLFTVTYFVTTALLSFAEAPPWIIFSAVGALMIQWGRVLVLGVKGEMYSKSLNWISIGTLILAGLYILFGSPGKSLSVISGEQQQVEITTLAPMKFCGLKEGKYTLKVVDTPISFIKGSGAEETIPSITGDAGDAEKSANLPRQKAGHYNILVNKARHDETVIIGKGGCTTLSWNITPEERGLFQSGTWKVEPTVVQFGLRQQVI
jgi:hypothetical protein